ncbi:BadF/BadG/BcrA/BcrD ATPase family protein [Streptomyces sp. NPDC088775]|uniref:BadF/BadG/BcrA/BcrD ATPase family protein n=1 Tax=Streptomyces sp. NPDC088775 TaxID=3365896 RepID=UPI00381C215C
MSGDPSYWLLIEGGGSRTWAARATRRTVTTEREGASTSPRSVGHGAAQDTLAALIGALPRSGRLRGVVAAHGAASTRAYAAEFAALTRRALTLCGHPPVPVLVTNDIVPLLLDQDGPLCVVICGTGTGFAARNGGRWARASGLEWLLSDEGGGYDLSARALRAAVRALDGRGPATALVDAARRWCPPPPGEALGEALLHAIHTEGVALKPHVASFAPSVMDAAREGDRVAAGLLDDAALELATGAQAVSRAVGLTAASPPALVLAGSLLTVDVLRERFLAQARARLGAAISPRVAGGPAPGLLHLLGLWQDPAAITALGQAIPLHTEPPAPDGPS